MCEEEIAGQARRGKQNIKTGTVDAGMGSGRELAKSRIDFGDYNLDLFILYAMSY